MKKSIILILIIFLFCGSILFALQKETNNQLQEATSLMDKGDYKAATELFDIYLSKNPKDTVALYNCALCHLYTARADIALNYLQRIKLYSSDLDADILNLLGLTNERVGNNDSAKYYYNQCIAKDKNYYEAYLSRGKLYVKENKIDSAFADFNYAKKNKIFEPELYIASGGLYYNCNMLDSALIDLKKVANNKEVNNNPYYLSLMGDIYYRNNTFDSAVTYYTKLIKIDTNNVSALNNRAMAYDQLEDDDKAKVDRDKIAELQRKFGIDPSAVTYQTLASADSLFSIDIPIAWRAFVRQSDSVDQIIFFDTKFDNSEVNGAYIYDCGGVINYNKKYWTPNSSQDNIMQREELNEKYISKIKEQFKDTEFFEIMRKRFNPNENDSKVLMKTSFVDKISHKKYYQTIYTILKADGKMLELIMWIPYENMFSNELLFDRIQESFKTNY